MTTPTDERREVLTVTAHMRAKPGREQDLREALGTLVASRAQEDGYVADDLHQGAETPAVFFYENREQNASDTEPVEMVVARSTQEAVVVAVDGHPHAPVHARKDP